MFHVEMKNPFKRKWFSNLNWDALEDRRGFVLVFTAVLLPLLIMVAAFAVDISLALAEHSKLQAAADHAARTAGMLRGENQTAAQITNGAIAVAAANGYVDKSNATVTVNICPTGCAGNFINYPSAVEVIITENKSTLYSSILSTSIIPHRARAVGDWDFAPCMVALSQGTTGNYGITNNGSTTFTAGCGLYSNSQNTKSSISASSGIIQANGFYIANSGGTNDANHLQTLSGDTGYLTLNAPLYVYPASFSTLSAALDIATASSIGLPACSPDSGNPGYCTKVAGKTNQWLLANNTINPGLVYTTFPPGSASSYTLQAGGLYYMTSLTLSGGQSIDGTAGASLLIYGSNPTISVSGQSNLDISAPTYSQNSTYASIAIMTGNTYNKKNTISLSGGTGGTGHPGISGIVAAPGTDIKVTGGSMTSTNCQTWFANSITISGSGGIGSGCTTTITNMSAFRAKNLVE